MKLIFKSIKLTNFLSYASASVSFDKTGFIIINGHNLAITDMASSNGSGKSSLLCDSLVWCLTGETIRGTKDVTRILCDETCQVELVFDVDNNTYKITRTQNPSNLKIYKNNEDISGKGIRDTSDILNKELPDITSSLIGSVVVLGQGLPQRFSNNTPSGRKEILEQLSKSDFMIADIKDRLSERFTKLTADKRILEDNLLETTTLKNTIEQTIKTLNTNLVELTKPDNKSLQDNIKILETIQLQITEIDEKINTLSNDIIILNKEKDSYALNNTSILEQLNINYTNAIKEGTDKNNILIADITRLSSEIEQLESIKDICPTCKRKLDGVIKPSTVLQHKQLDKLLLEKQEITTNLDILKNKYNEEISSIKEAYTETTTKVTTKINNCQVKIIDLTNNKTALINKFNKVTTIINNLKTAEELYTSLKIKYEKDIEINKTNLTKCNEKILYINNSLDNLTKHIDVINKMKNLITRDFRGYLLENVIAFINKKIKEYAITMFGHTNIDLILDKNNLNIIFNNKVYEQLSGGERQKIDVIIQLAIRSMLCTYLSFSSNIFILDEVTDNLDSVGTDKLFNLLTTSLTDIETIFIISHHSTDLQIPIDNEIIIEKGEDGISRIIN